MSPTLQDVKNEIFELMDQGKYRKPVKIMQDLFNDINPANINEFGDLIVEIIKKDSEFFIDKLYQAFQFVLRKSPQDKLYKLDKYMIEKYSLIEGENLKDSFYGSIIDNYKSVSGRLFITNLRIIACGPSIQVSKTGKPGSKSLIGTVRLIRKEYIHAAIGKAIRKALNKDVADLVLLPYGYYYPVHNTFKIKRTKKAISYHVDIDYKRKEKVKTEKLDITVAINKKLTDPSRFSEILSLLENLLTENQ